jgi:hypothetical protein
VHLDMVDPDHPEDQQRTDPQHIERHAPTAAITSRMTLKMLHRLVVSQRYIQLGIFAVGIAAIFAIYASYHNKGNTQDLHEQNTVLTHQNKVLGQQVDKLGKAVENNRAETLKNRDNGLVTRGIICDTLKAVDALAWNQSKECQAIRPPAQ